MLLRRALPATRHYSAHPFLFVRWVLYCRRMFEIRAKEKMVERALLVGAYIGADKKADAQSLLEE